MDKSETKKDTQEMRFGAVTLLDILGWKGIWQRKEDAIDSLLKLIRLSYNKRDLLIGDKQFRDLEVEIKSISDTIALVTYGDVNISLEFHSRITSILVSQSILEGIPLRGATSYGKLSTRDSIMVGPAIDEVAAWYEKSNWIGVILTPSALFQIDTSKFRFINRLVEYPVQIKNFNKMKLLCVDWTNVWTHNKYDRAKLLELFLDNAPVLPDVYEKFINTLDFYDFCLKNANVNDLSNVEVAATKEVII